MMSIGLLNCRITKGVAVLVVLCCAALLANAQSFSVIHTFMNGADGGGPGNVIVDQASNLYGIAGGGENNNCTLSYGCGLIFRMQNRGSGWTFATLYAFSGGSDGAGPGNLAFGPDGKIYGATSAGGVDGDCLSNDGCGTLFTLQPPATICPTVSCPWLLTTFYTFPGGNSGGSPGGPVTFDQDGNIYDTLGVAPGDNGFCKGDGACGAVARLWQQDGVWNEQVIANFAENNLGGGPSGGLVMDRQGNLYGTLILDAVYRLFPNGDGNWTANVLHDFFGTQNGNWPYGGVVFDQTGNLYGSTSMNGVGGGGTIFQMTPDGGGWPLSTIYSFTGSPLGGPWAGLNVDASGNLYGSTKYDGLYGQGSVFKLTPTGGGWIYTSLHDFTGGTDGAEPLSSISIDQAGNLYGTTSAGGDVSACGGSGCGVVFKITP